MFAAAAKCTSKSVLKAACDAGIAAVNADDDAEQQ
jgi:hypothetical protein